MKRILLLVLGIAVIGQLNAQEDSWWNRFKNQFGYGSASEVTKHEYQSNIPFEEERLKAKEYLIDNPINVGPAIENGDFDKESPGYRLHISSDPKVKTRLETRMTTPGYEYKDYYWRELYERKHKKHYKPTEYKETRSLNPEGARELAYTVYGDARDHGEVMGFKYGKHLGRYEGARNAALVGAGIAGAAALGYGAVQAYRWWRGPINHIKNKLNQLVKEINDLAMYMKKNHKVSADMAKILYFASNDGQSTLSLCKSSLAALNNDIKQQEEADKQVAAKK